MNISMDVSPTTVLIMGAAGRDFHNFNTLYRDKPEFDVRGITATQIPGIEERMYPASLAGELYPQGIPIMPERDLEQIISEQKIQSVVFSYSDVPHQQVMDLASRVQTAGAQFVLPDLRKTMIKSRLPVVSVCAVRTGCGKSQTTRKVVEVLKDMGLTPVVVRHPMPYDPNLEAQAVQRFSSVADLKKHRCTIEEMEEYEPHIANETVVYAGVDYGRILGEVEKEAGVVVWDGGNNDTPFYTSDRHLQIVVVDPLRPGHELTYYPGLVNLRMADVLVMNKMDSATAEGVETLERNINDINPSATLVIANSEITVGDEKVIKDKRLLVIEDGPTLTHGEMTYGAGYLAAVRFGGSGVVHAYPFAVDSIKETYHKYKRLMETGILPAMGYGEEQMIDLQRTIEAASDSIDGLVVGTPIDLGRFITFNKPSTRARYNLKEIGGTTIEDVLRGTWAAWPK